MNVLRLFFVLRPGNTCLIYNLETPLFWNEPLRLCTKKILMWNETLQIKLDHLFDGSARTIDSFYRYKMQRCICTPSIAQLVERRTVDVISSFLSRWFESGSKDCFFFSAITFPKIFQMQHAKYLETIALFKRPLIFRNIIKVYNTLINATKNRQNH